MVRLFRLACPLLAFLAPVVARAQCTSGLISNCPQAISPQATDSALGWQFGQTPHTRQFQWQQITNAGFPTTLPAWTTGTRPASPNSGQTGLNTTTGQLEAWSGASWLSPAGIFLPVAGGTVTGGLGVNASTSLGVGTNWVQPAATPMAGELWSFQDVDPSALSSNWRSHIFGTTLTLAGNSNNIWENNNSFLQINGPGIQEVEINLNHSFFEINAGGNANGSVEDYEASNLNNGASNTFIDYLALSHNGAAGTVSGNWFGMKIQFQNDNTTSGAIFQYAGIDFERMLGSGSVPGFYEFIRNADPNGPIVSLGSLTLGSLTPPGAGVLLSVVGSDTSGTTFPVNVKSSNGTNSLLINDANVVIPAALAMGTTAAPIGSFVLYGVDNLSTTFPLQVKSANGNNSLLVTDSNAVILGALAIGTTTAPASTAVIFGPDLLSTTFPLQIKNSGGDLMLSVNDAGGVIVNGITVFTSSVTYPGVQMLLQGPDTSGSTPILKLQNSTPALMMQVFDSGDIVLGSGSALATTATAGFTHLPFTTNTPTGTPASINGDACLFNTLTTTLNCYIGASWYHTTLSAGAG